MLLWKEIRETVPLFAFAFAAMVAVAFLRWKGWRPELLEFQFWVVVVVCLPFVIIYSGACAVAGEREGRTLDFLCSRPVGLVRIFLIKYVIRLGCLVVVLLALATVFDFIRPTHNLNLDDVAKGVVILFSFLLYALSLSFSLSCFSDTPAKAFVSSLILLWASLFLINATPLFRYAWLWGNSMDELWTDYFWFYAALSFSVVVLSCALIKRKTLLEYQWRHLGVAALICFLLFVRSASTTFWLIPYIAMYRDTELVTLVRAPIEDVLLHIAQRKSGSDIITRYLRSLDRSNIDEELLKAFRNPDAQVRNTAVKLLTERRTRGASAAVASLLDDPDDSVRHSVLEYLRVHPLRQATPKLVGLLKDKNSSIRVRAIDALVPLQGKNSVKYLIPLLKDPNPRVRGRAIARLCSLDCAEAQPEIVELLLHHRVDSVRQSAAYSLREMKSEPACEALIQALSDDDRRVVDYAATSLGALHCESAVRPLTHVVERDPLRYMPVVSALGAIGGPEADAALKKLFSGANTPAAVKVETAFALAKMGDEEAHQFLREQANHFARKEPTIFTSRSASRLAEMKDFSAIPMLIRLLGEYQWRGYSYAQVLTELTGKYYGWDAKRWQKWWDKNKDELLTSAPKNENGGD